MVGSSEGPSDLGRRIVAQRQSLDLSLEQVAAGAAMDPGYLEYLESAPDPDPSRACLIRLAMVLRTTVASLQGGGLQHPPGSGGAATTPSLHPLDAVECRALLGTGGVGRLVFVEERGPVAVPVNFRLLGDEVVFRTGAATSLTLCAGQRRVSFEVDHIDEALGEGWSVLLSGEANVVSDGRELAQVQALGVQPWAGGQRDRYFRIVPEVITGRRIRATSADGEEM